MLTKDEVAGVLAALDGQMRLIARLLYGTGMRLMEGLRLRVKDVDFSRHVAAQENCTSLPARLNAKKFPIAPC